MRSRKFSHCIWCRRTIDVTNHPDDQLCPECSKYPNIREMLKAQLSQLEKE